MAQLTSIELWPAGRHGRHSHAWIRHAMAAGRLELLLKRQGMAQSCTYPLVNIQKAIENGHL